MVGRTIGHLKSVKDNPDLRSAYEEVRVYIFLVVDTKLNSY